MSKYKIFTLCMVLTVLSGVAMSDSLNKDFVASTRVLKKDLENVFNNSNIYFAHQSVGGNIIKGAQSLLNRSGIDLNIRHINEIESEEHSGFYHSEVGVNEQPYTKIEEFKKIVSIDMKDKLDYASLKFCFVDVTKNTNAEELFGRYKEVVETIETANPKLSIIHFTVPLMTVQEEGLRTFFKQLLGKPIGGYNSNIVRNQFNTLLRAEYSGKSPIFDIANLESTLLDGERVTFKQDGTEYYSLAHEYTDDGGHLNELGRDYIGYEYLKFLSKLNVSIPLEDSRSAE
jgi:hypothetical protein